MYTYEIADILFFIKSTRNSTSSFNYITFYTGSSQLAKEHKSQIPMVLTTTPDIHTLTESLDCRMHYNYR